VAEPLTGPQWRIIAALFGVMALTIFHSIAYYQNNNIGLIWINTYVDLDVLRFHIPVSWFSALDSFVSIISVPVLFALWRRQTSRGGEPGEIAKIATGAYLAAGANLSLAAGSMLFARVPAVFPVLYGVLLGVGFLYQWPTLLALVSRAAPTKVKATMMGAAFLSLFIANITLGRIGTLYEHMTPSMFWVLNAAIAATGGTLALLLRRRLGRVFAAIA
jgi:POT family proton-dependent oligopeptide transporter